MNPGRIDAMGVSEEGGDRARDVAAGKPPGKAEAAKLASRYLGASVADEIGGGRANFSEDTAAVLKFHGSYQKDDRDARSLLKHEGKEKAFQFMDRVRMPGAKFTTTAQ